MRAALASWRVGDTRSVVVVVVVVDIIADCAARLNSPRATEHAAKSFGLGLLCHHLITAGRPHSDQSGLLKKYAFNSCGGNPPR